MSQDKLYFYLAGPMTGYPQFNFPAFTEAANRLRYAGFNIVSPAELDDPEVYQQSISSPDGKAEYDNDYRALLHRDVNIVMHPNCVGVICLPGWEKSKGAGIETFIAQEFDRALYFYDEGTGFDFELLSLDREKAMQARKGEELIARLGRKIGVLR